MSSMQTKASNTIFAIITLLTFTLFLGSCGQDSSDSSTASTSDEDTTITTLSAPSGLSATAGDSQASLSWSAVSGASSYTLYWKTSSGVSSSDTSIASISTNSYTHTSLTNGSTYYYKVAAVNSSGTGTLSSEVSTTPAADSGSSSATTLSAPTNLTATASTGTATLDWDAVSGATGYTLFWGTSNGITSSSSAITSISTDSYTHTSLTNDTVYYYKVAAVDASGTGGLSSEVSTTPAVATGSSPAPANLTVTASTGTATLDWDAVSGATSYTLYWATSNGISTSSSAITSISTDNYTHSSLSNGSTYYYKVAAIDATGVGTLSSEVSAAPVLSVPANFSATATNSQTSLDWDNVSGATSYTLYWGTANGITSSSSSIASISTSNYTHSSLTNGTAYYYKVAAVDASSTGTLSSEVSATPVNLLVGGSIQSGPLTLSTKVTTFAGTGSSGSTDNSTGTLASFDYPSGITTDGTNLYITDSDNNKIRQIVISSGEVTTIAGTGAACYNLSDCDGTGILAKMNNPKGITTDGTNLYWSEYNNHTIRKMVLSSGVVTTLAGTTSAPGTSNGTGTAARFEKPYGLTTDGTNLYVADETNNMIRKIVISTGLVSTVAGSTTRGGADLSGTNASFHSPKGITMDATHLYVAELFRVRKIVISSGLVSTLAGPTGVETGYPGTFTDSAGNSVKFSELAGITSDGTNLYLAGRNNYSILKVVISTGAVTTIAGDDCSGCNTYLDHDNGTSARFKYPFAITTDGTFLYVSESNMGTDNHRIRRIE